MTGLAPLRLGILVATQTFIICFLGYYLDGRHNSVGVCAIIMGVMAIYGLWIYPAKKESSDG